MHKSMHIILCFDTDFWMLAMQCIRVAPIYRFLLHILSWTALNGELIKLYFHFVLDFFAIIFTFGAFEKY